MPAPDLTTLSDDDLDRLLDDAVFQASQNPPSLEVSSHLPTSDTPIPPHNTSGKQPNPSPQNPPHQTDSKQLTKPRTSQADGKSKPKRPGPALPGPGRPKGLLIGKYTQKRQQRDMQVIAAALGVEAARQNPAGLGQVGPRDYFQAILDNPAAPPEERRDAAKQLAAIDARGKEVAKVEEINWDNLTSAQRRQGIDACKLLTDLRHISHKRDPEFGMV